MTPRKHGWPFWFAIALIALPILYVASVGPAYWLLKYALIRDLIEEDAGNRVIVSIYTPLWWFVRFLPMPIRVALDWYVDLL